MIPHDFMTMHAAKMVEYLLAVAYLLLFIPFWRFVNAPARGAQAHAPVHAPRPAAEIQERFAVPDGLFYHPGHAWMRVDGPDTVTVGFDDFARKLVGSPSAIVMPAVGTVLAQGERAWTLVADGKTIDMLSPLDGTVVAVNERARRSPAIAHERPYDEGWLLKVRSTRLAVNAKQLLTGRFAKRWIDDLTDALRGDFTPALGQLSADGGVVVDGLARVLEPDAWDEVARRFFLTDGVAPELGARAAAGDQSNGGNHA